MYAWVTICVFITCISSFHDFISYICTKSSLFHFHSKQKAEFKQNFILAHPIAYLIYWKSGEDYFLPIEKVELKTLRFPLNNTPYKFLQIRRCYLSLPLLLPLLLLLLTRPTFYVATAQTTHSSVPHFVKF